MSEIELNRLTDEEVFLLDFAIYEQLIRLIRVQQRQKSSEQHYNLDILQSLRLKISKWQHSCCIKRFLKNNG